MEININIHKNRLSEVRILASLNQLKEIIMGTQADFDAKVEAINAKLDGLATGLSAAEEAVHLEAEQVRQFIADNPSVDTSALDGVAERLDTASSDVARISGSVAGIMADAPPTDPETPVG